MRWQWSSKPEVSRGVTGKRSRSAQCLIYAMSLRPGFSVIATVRNLKLFDVLRKEGLNPVQLDITSEASIAECLSEVEKLVGGHLDILINNA